MSCSKFAELQIDLNDIVKSKKELVVIGERRFSLNNSKSKYVSVGLARDYEYEPCIILKGNKNDVIIFSEEEWNGFLEYQGIITNYIYSNNSTDPIHSKECSIFFEQISSARVIRIWKNNSYVYLGYESICKLWELLTVIKFRTDMLKKQEFLPYFRVLQKSLQNQAGNLFVYASRILYTNERAPTENVCLALEFMHTYPTAFEEDCSRKI